MASPTQKDQAELRFRKLFVAITVVLLTVLFLRMIAPFLQALLLAIVLTGMLYPLYMGLRDRFSNEVLASTATVMLVLIAVIVPLLFLIGTFSREAIRLSEVIAPLMEQAANGEALPAQLP